MRTQKILIALMIAAFISLIGVAAILFYANRTPTLGGNFEAVSVTGAWHFADEAKDLNLLYIGYAKCPDVCPLALSYSREAVAKFSVDELKRLRVLFLSVDTEHDTPQSVAEYAKQFDPNFIGLTGSKNQIDRAVNLFGASYIVELNPKSYLGYSIAHTDRIFFLNKKGIVIDSITSPRSSEIIVEKIKEHL